MQETEKNERRNQVNTLYFSSAKQIYFKIFIHIFYYLNSKIIVIYVTYSKKFEKGYIQS